MNVYLSEPGRRRDYKTASLHKFAELFQLNNKLGQDPSY
jgi:hypothetical protein